MPPLPISLPSERVKPSRARWATRSRAADRLGRGAEHHDAGAGLEAAHQRGEELLEGDQAGGVGDAGGVEDQGLVRLALGRGGGRGDAEAVEDGGQLAARGGRRRRARPCRRTSGCARGVPLEPGGAGEAEVLHQQLADRRGRRSPGSGRSWGVDPPVESRREVRCRDVVTTGVTRCPHFVTWRSSHSLPGVLRARIGLAHPDQRSQMTHMQAKTRRVAVLGGNRIPFARSNTVYADASNQEMLTAAIDGLVARFGLEGERRRRGRRRCRAQARPRLQPDPRVGARLQAVARDPRDRHPAGLRHRPPGGDPGRATRSRSARSTSASPAAPTPPPTPRSRSATSCARS